MLSKTSTKKFASILGAVFIASGLICGVIFFIQYGTSGFTPEAFETYANKVDIEEIADLQGIDTIYVETTSSDITLTSSDSNEVRAHFYGSYSTSSNSFKPELVVTRNGDKLLIKIEDSVGLVLSYISNLRLEVYIPSQYSESVKVKSASGKVVFGELSIKELSLETSSGNIQTEAVSAQKANIDTSSGEVKFKGKFTELKVKSTSGDIISDNVEAEDSKFESSSGAIKFNGKFSELTAISTSGDITSASIETKSSKFESSSGEIAVSGSLANITAKTTSGDITLSSTENPQTILIITNSGRTRLELPDSAGFKLTCKSGSGEINSDFPVTVITTNNRNEHKLDGTVGDGIGSVKITSTSGDINIVK